MDVLQRSRDGFDAGTRSRSVTRFIRDSAQCAGWMSLGRNNRKMPGASSFKPPCNLAAHAAGLGHEQTCTRLIRSMPWSEAWYPSPNGPPIDNPVIAKPVAKILLFVPSRQARRIDVGHDAGRA